MDNTMKKESFLQKITYLSSILCLGIILNSSSAFANDGNVTKKGTNNMKKVVLIGDSIRMGYQNTVKDELKNIAVVAFPNDNCNHSQNIIQNHLPWILAQQPDIVHINAGLHELYSGEDGKKKISIAEYQNNLRKIFDALKSNNIKILWATTTPVIDEWYLKEKGYQARKNEDVISYNKAAIEVVKEYSLPVDDLYSFIYTSPEIKELYSKDGVHHNGYGAAKIGKKVAAFITEYIQTKTKN